MRSVHVSDHHAEMINYAIGKRGIEPKFKYEVKPVIGSPNHGITIEQIIRKVILGRSASGPSKIKATKQMFRVLI